MKYSKIYRLIYGFCNSIDTLALIIDEKFKILFGLFFFLPSIYSLKEPYLRASVSEQTVKYQRYLTAIRTYFTRWLIRTNSYDLSNPQWRVGLGAGLGVGHSF